MVVLNIWFSNSFYRIIMYNCCENVLSCKYHSTLLMIYPHWFTEWLGAVRQQFISYANVDADLCHHMTLQDHHSMKPRDAYMRRQPRTSLVQMACRLLGDKPLSDSVLEYCQLNPWEQTSVKFASKFKHFHFVCENRCHFVSASMC